MIIQLTDETYDGILKNERIAVVKVYANWCGPCKFMKSHYEKWSDQFTLYNGIKVPFYEIENDKNKEFVARYKVTKLPTTAFFVHGIQVFTIEGMTRVSVFEETLKKSLEVKYDIKKG